MRCGWRRDLVGDTYILDAADSGTFEFRIIEFVDSYFQVICGLEFDESGRMLVILGIEIIVY